MFARRSFPCLIALALLLAGCDTTPMPPARREAQVAEGGPTSAPRLEAHVVDDAPPLLPAHDQEPEGARQEAPPVQPPAVEAPLPSLTPPVTTNAPVSPTVKAKPTALWVDWEGWLSQHGRPPVKVIPGSRRALWAGAAVYLGFEPRLFSGRVEVFHRDVEKTFEALLATNSPVRKVPPLIVIDPGHGGTNWGTRSLVGNAHEKEYTLDWALRLQALLEAKGWWVVLTRTNDASLELPERVAEAEKAGAALFISLHFNAAFPNKAAHGLETYCLTPQGLPSNVVRDFADDASVPWPNNAFDAENVRLAMHIHRRLLRATGAEDRGVKRARFMGVLRGQNRPAILIEGGYLSNPQEARKIATPEYRQKLAEAVADALN
ncbi:MAG TPA: N-acetylmuramoyl-L-alanine amidase [Candidatus Limnocylindria bacterium]|nr:N-acetylmuramoyl-L-alanine amidase [Candidatus Limnocylindria bacterium]